MNKLHRKIAHNQERWLKKLAAQVEPIDREMFQVNNFYAQAYFTPKAASHTVMKLRRSKCQSLARYIRRVSLPTQAHGTYFNIKWPMFIYASVDNDVTSSRAKAWLVAYRNFIHVSNPPPFTRF